jgi:predicted metalloprotease with PDZ domain
MSPDELTCELKLTRSVLPFWSFWGKIPSLNYSPCVSAEDVPPTPTPSEGPPGESVPNIAHPHRRTRAAGNSISTLEVLLMNMVARTFLIILLPALVFSQTPSLQYKLSMSKPSTHLLEVELTVKGVPSSPTSLDFQIPVWRTGRYVVFDFSGGVQEFSATDASGTPVHWAKTDKSTWRVEKGRAASVTIRYKVYANEFEQRTRGLNDEHAFIDGCAVFMFLEKYRSLPHTVTVVPYQDWHVTTGLESVAGDRFTFKAKNLDELMDSPMEIGNQKDFEFDVEGKKHALSIFGAGNYDPQKMTADISKIVKANKDFWGDLPYQRYVFFLHLGLQGGGGTEHLNSTIMQTGPFGFKNPGSYHGFLGLVSHEYFHTWNVKQLRPKGIAPYDYTKENYVYELWVAEGTTSYYSGLMLQRAGLSTSPASYDWLAATVRSERERPGNRIQSVSESSFDAWVKYWKEHQQGFNSESDYYGKGSEVSLVLDLEIRQHSNNKYSLDDVMRTLYKRFPLGGRGYSVDDLRSISEQLAGTDLKKFFDDYVNGTVPIDWERYLGYAGLSVQAKDSERKISLGMMTADRDNRTRVTGVSAGSPAYDAGVDLGDEVIALNGLRVRTSDLSDRLADYKPGDKVKLTVFRRDRMRDFEITLRLQDVPSYKIAKIEQPTALQKSIFESWLKMTWE